MLPALSATTALAARTDGSVAGSLPDSRYMKVAICSRVTTCFGHHTLLAVAADRRSGTIRQPPIPWSSLWSGMFLVARTGLWVCGTFRPETNRSLIVSVASVSLLSLQLQGRPTALLSGNLWFETDDTQHVQRWGVTAVLEREMTLPDESECPVRAKSGPHIVEGTATVWGERPLPGGYWGLNLRGSGRLSGIDAFIA